MFSSSQQSIGRKSTLSPFIIVRSGHCVALEFARPTLVCCQNMIFKRCSNGFGESGQPLNVNFDIHFDNKASLGRKWTTTGWPQTQQAGRQLKFRNKAINVNDTSSNTVGGVQFSKNSLLLLLESQPRHIIADTSKTLHCTIHNPRKCPI